MGCHLVDHPLVRARITVLRDRNTGLELFRRTLRELSTLMAYEALRDLPERPLSVETPLAVTAGSRLERPVVIMPILRAGLGMAEAVSEILPDAAVGHIGMYRDEETLQPQQYLLRVPPGIEDAEVLVVDPMLATGNSGAAALDKLKGAGARRLRLICLVGCPQGVRRIAETHPDVPVYLAAMDDGLNDQGYIMPGLGDAGDRYYGT
jgi:uracil phosphoribosyltransferase